MYDDIAQKVLTVDRFILPAHGIPEPDQENPMNLFKRQLKVEELSFELAHKRYQKSLSQLISIGRADSLATSHRYILAWTRLLERAITEQQKIFVKRGNLDPARSKLGYHLVQMPSDKIAALCVVHLMKHLFAKFSSDINSYDIQYLLDKHDPAKDGEVPGEEIKIPAVKLFQELGKLFDAELKEGMAQKSNKKSESMMNSQYQQDVNSIESRLLADDHEIGAIDR
jgi:hypothetical protein